MLRGGHPGSHTPNGPQHPPVSIGYRGLPPQAPSPIPSTSGPPPPCPPQGHDLSTLPPGVREIKPINPSSLGGGYSGAHGKIWSSLICLEFLYSRTSLARSLKISVKSGRKWQVALQRWYFNEIYKMDCLKRWPFKEVACQRRFYCILQISSDWCRNRNC